MNSDRRLEERLRRLSWPVDRGRGWDGIEAQAGEKAGSHRRVSVPKTPGPRRRSRLRVAVFASIAVVVVAALTIGTLEAVKHLGKDRSILVITDDTIDPSTAGQIPPTTATAAATEGSGLYPVCVDAKWGYIDSTGAIKIRPQFDAAGEFSEGRAMVGVGITENGIGKWGYIDTTGAVVIEPQFDLAGDFSEGLAAVGTGLQESGEIGPNGYIDPSGTVVIPLQYEEAWSFSEGLGRVRDADGNCFFVDNTGTQVLGPYDEAHPFSEGLAWAEVGSKRGFIQENGDWIAVAKLATSGPGSDFDLSDGFSEGLATMETSAMPPLTGYMDKTGAWVIEPRFRLARRFSEGLAVVGVGETGDGVPAIVMVGASPRKYGYIDQTGAWVIEPQFDGASDFSEGLAMVYARDIVDGVMTGSGKCGYIDKTGKVVIPIQYEMARDFSGGLAAVWDGTASYESGPSYIDKTGKVIWQAQ